jgi:hypothetical protein
MVKITFDISYQPLSQYVLNSTANGLIFYIFFAATGIGAAGRRSLGGSLAALLIALRVPSTHWGIFSGIVTTSLTYIASYTTFK